MTDERSGHQFGAASEPEWVWPAYGYEQWEWSDMNGWVNPEDDPASPTEDALLWEIERLRAALAAERAEVERLRTAGDALAEVVDDWPELVAAWKEARRER